jgi:ABC-type amino acid transport substrate-binding protein
VDHSPPFYSIEPDGTVHGLAVDVFNEAARRRGIRLVWTPLHDIPVETALDYRMVDVWPLVAATPEREARFYISEPWLESEYILVSTQEHPVSTPAEAAGKTIAHARLKFTGIIAGKYLSQSREKILILRSEALQALCRGEADAALVESRLIDSILLTRPDGCEKVSFTSPRFPARLRRLQ